MDELGTADNKLEYGLWLAKEGAPSSSIVDHAEIRPEEFKRFAEKIGLNLINKNYRKNSEGYYSCIKCRKWVVL